MVETNIVDMAKPEPELVESMQKNNLSVSMNSNNPGDEKSKVD